MSVATALRCPPPCITHVATAASNWVVQKYLEKPLLVAGRKFDIRAYALVRGPLPADPSPGSARVWFHQEAYVRTSGTPYKPDDLSDRWGMLFFEMQLGYEGCAWCLVG